MGITTFTASLSSTSTTSQSDWTAWSACCQGSPDGGLPRVGAMLFPDLHKSANWARETIHRISLTLTFDASGTLREKTLYMFRGTQKTFTGTGSAMIGEVIGEVLTNGPAYETTQTITFDAETNADAFTNLVAWLSESEAPMLVFYNDKQTSSIHYLQITAATMKIEYDSSPVYVRSNESWVSATPYVYANGKWVEALASYVSAE